MPEPLLQVRSLSKTFPGLKALDDVSLSLGPGEIMALVGQNGSGKSTLVKILAGVHQADPGSEVELGSAQGGDVSLHFIHQDLGLVGTLSTIENLDLDRPLGGSAIEIGKELRPDDEIELEIEGLGVLRNRLGRPPKNGWTPPRRNQAAT